ncbi:MAG: LysE family translocator [Marinilabiliaceae bacterium]|nr:LysE family translocator [Marinilabiliaceae bacterium]
MFGIHHYIGFVLAGVVLNITPGTDTIYILTRSITQGRRAGVFSVLGIATGCLVHTLLAAFGLSVVLAQSPMLFGLVRYAGVAYLVYLGIRMLASRSSLLDVAEQSLEGHNLTKIYRQGLLTNVLNPKMALFFLSMLPQFIDPQSANGPLPFVILGLTFMTTGTLWCLFLAYAASGMSQMLRQNQRLAVRLQKASGMVYITLGIRLMLD